MEINKVMKSGTTEEFKKNLQDAIKTQIKEKQRMVVEKAKKIKNIIGPERIVTFHLSGHQLSDKGLIGFSGMVRYETMTEAQLDKFISKLKLWKRLPLLRFFM